MNTRNQAAFARASQPRSLTNIQTVVQAGLAAGLNVDPGVDVLTFHAWLANGRCVRKGEKALCKLRTFITATKKYDDKEDETYSHPRSVAVFHISQTEVK